MSSTKKLRFLNEEITMPLIVGLMGQKFAGKSTFVKLTQKYLGSDFHIVHLRTSDVLHEMCVAAFIPDTNDNLKKMAVFLKREFGESHISYTLAERVKCELARNDTGIYFLDGLRWDSDIRLLRSYPLNCLVYITCDNLDTILDRCHKRSDRSDEAEMTREKLIELRNSPTEIEIARLGQQADFPISNNESQEAFETEVHTLIQIMLKLVPLPTRHYDGARPPGRA